jgi:hypothetical protein
MNNDTRHELLSHEVPPPPGAWDRIASALDESGSGLSFPGRLKEMEVAAPAQTWDKIAAALDATSGPAIVTKHIPWLRYAAAAAIIGFITWGALTFFNKNNTSAPEIASVQEKQQVAPVPAQIDPKKGNDELNITDAQRDDAALEESKRTFASVDIASIARRHHISHVQLTERVELASMTGQVNPASTYQELACDEVAQPKVKVTEDSNLATRYVLLMTPDGKLIRISRKWSSMLCCVSGEESDPDCKDQVKEWRARVAGALNAPSSGNFMDIISLVNSLQQN